MILPVHEGIDGSFINWANDNAPSWDDYDSTCFVITKTSGRWKPKSCVKRDSFVCAKKHQDTADGETDEITCINTPHQTQKISRTAPLWNQENPLSGCKLQTPVSETVLIADPTLMAKYAYATVCIINLSKRLWKSL